MPNKSRFIRNEYFGISGLRCGFQFKLDGLYNSKPDGTAKLSSKDKSILV